MDDYEKYIKYKSKYMKLRNIKQKGGEPMVLNIKSKLSQYANIFFNFTDETTKIDIINEIKKNIEPDKYFIVRCKFLDPERKEKQLNFDSDDTSHVTLSSLGLDQNSIRPISEPISYVVVRRQPSEAQILGGVPISINSVLPPYTKFTMKFTDRTTKTDIINEIYKDIKQNVYFIIHCQFDTAIGKIYINFDSNDTSNDTLSSLGLNERNILTVLEPISYEIQVQDINKIIASEMMKNIQDIIAALSRGYTPTPVINIKFKTAENAIKALNASLKEQNV